MSRSRRQMSEFVDLALRQEAMTYADLAERFRDHPLAVGKRMSPEYLRRKVNETRWTVDDIDILADIFDIKPWQVLGGFEVKLRQKPDHDTDDRAAPTTTTEDSEARSEHGDVDPD